MPPLVAAAGVTALGGLVGGAISSHAANNAAEVQSGAAMQAAKLQADAAQRALEFEQQQAAQAQKNYNDTTSFNRGVYQTQQANLGPYRAAGAGSLADLARPIYG